MCRRTERLNESWLDERGSQHRRGPDGELIRPVEIDVLVRLACLVIHGVPESDPIHVVVLIVCLALFGYCGSRRVRSSDSVAAIVFSKRIDGSVTLKDLLAEQYA